MKYNIFSEIINILIIIFNSIIITVIPLNFNKYYSKLKIKNIEKYLFFLNVIPIISIYFLIFGLIGNAWITFIILALVSYILSLVNYFKIYYREEPLLISDFKLMFESMNMANEYSIKLTAEMILICVLILMYTFLLSKISIFIGILNRLLYTILGIVALYFVYNNKYYSLDKYYFKISEKIQDGNWSESDNYQYHGFIYPLLYSFNRIKTQKENDAEKIYSNNILNKFESSKKNVNINFISLMLESFAYFGEYNIPWINYPYKNFDKYKKKSLYGNLITDVFGGGTVETENSFLTGFSDKLSSKRAYYSFASNLKENDYETVAFHPNGGWFYHRSTFYKNIGFNKFYDIKDLNINSKDSHNDEIFFNAFIEKCDMYLKNEKNLFAFGISFQNHGPYSTEIIRRNEFVSNRIHSDNLNIFNNYISGISKTDDNLEKIFDFVENSDKPIILTIFGDHRPWIGFEGYGYEELGINMGRNSIEGFLNYYKTPYLIYGNNVAKKLLKRDFEGELAPFLSPNMLLPSLFKYIDFNSHGYGNFLSDISDEISVVNGKFLRVHNRFIRNDLKNEKYLYEYSIIERHSKGEKYD